MPAAAAGRTQNRRIRTRCGRSCRPARLNCGRRRLGRGDAVQCACQPREVRRSGTSFGSAGINRHRERNERVRHRRSSAPRWPWAMRWRPRGRWRSVGQGYVQAGLLSREISVSGCRRCPNERKATSPTAFYARAVGGPRAVREPLHAGSLDAREPGDPTLAQPADRGWAAQGRPWPYAWDVRAWEVGSPRSTDEAAEQGHGRGGGGGKGARRGEPGRHDTPRTLASRSAVVARPTTPVARHEVLDVKQRHVRFNFRKIPTAEPAGLLG